MRVDVGAAQLGGPGLLGGARRSRYAATWSRGWCGLGSHVPWCPGSDIRIPSRQVRLRMSEPKGHKQTLDSSVVLDLTFASRTRGDTEANVKSTTRVPPI